MQPTQAQTWRWTETRSHFTFTPPTAEAMAKATEQMHDIIKSYQTVSLPCRLMRPTHRAPSAGSSTVKQYTTYAPAPGQFIYTDFRTDRRRSLSLTCMNVQNNYVSLGCSWGGYIIVDLTTAYTTNPDVSSNIYIWYIYIYIIGNPFDLVVRNWYRLRHAGRKRRRTAQWHLVRTTVAKPERRETYQHYAVTYYRPPTQYAPAMDRQPGKLRLHRPQS